MAQDEINLSSLNREVGVLATRIQALEATDKLLCEAIRAFNERQSHTETYIERVNAGSRVLVVLGSLAITVTAFAEKIGLTKLLWGK